VPLSRVPDTTITRLNSQTIPRYRTNTLRSTLERDTRNERIAPVRGSYQTLVGEQAGGWLKGQTAYRKAILSSTWYTPFTNGWQLAARAAGGIMGPFGQAPENFTPDLGVDPQVSRVPREARFFVGGVNSMRGYGENAVTRDGGLAMAQANIELRMPVAGPFGVELFLDAGNVWDRPAYIHGRDLVFPWQATRSRPGDIRYTYGAGARLVLPFGPLRIDFARCERPDFAFSTWNHKNLPFVFQFAIGPSF
jgi:outer membrane protein assembly factor BamA